MHYSGISITSDPESVTLYHITQFFIITSRFNVEMDDGSIENGISIIQDIPFQDKRSSNLSRLSAIVLCFIFSQRSFLPTNQFSSKNGDVIILIIHIVSSIIFMSYCSTEILVSFRISRRKMQSHEIWFTTILVKSLTKFMLDLICRSYQVFCWQVSISKILL